MHKPNFPYLKYETMGTFKCSNFLFLFDRYAFIGYTGYNVFERR